MADSWRLERSSRIFSYKMVIIRFCVHISSTCFKIGLIAEAVTSSSPAKASVKQCKGSKTLASFYSTENCASVGIICHDLWSSAKTAEIACCYSNILSIMQ